MSDATVFDDGAVAPTGPLRRLAARTPLRVKLVAAVVLLSALALAIAGVSAVTGLRSYLLGRVDSQLNGLAAGDRGPGPAPGGSPDPFTNIYRLRVPAGSAIGEEQLPYGVAGPQLPTGKLPTSPSTVPSRKAGEASWRIVGVRRADGDIEVYGVSLADLHSTTNRLAVLELLVGGVILLLLGGSGLLLVRRSLRPLVEMGETAGAIAAGDLHRRVPESDPRTEVGQLGQSLNRMLEEIEAAFAARERSEAAARTSEDRMRRFVTDASHELRTPLTSIRGFAELYRQGATRDQEGLARLMRRIEDEAARMGLLVEDLLLLARLDQQRPLEHKPVDLLSIVTDAAQDARAVAPDREIDLVVDATPVVLGDDARLRQVMGNLVSNALAHTPTTSRVTVRLASEEGAAVIEVSDQGPGLEAEAAARVFERFYRADKSRTRSSGGAGLGLSIVASIVAAHGGSVTVDSAPESGSTFRIRLPAGSAPPLATVDEDEAGTSAPSDTVEAV